MYALLSVQYVICNDIRNDANVSCVFDRLECIFTITVLGYWKTMKYLITNIQESR